MVISNTSAYVLDFTIILSLVITLFQHVPFWHHKVEWLGNPLLYVLVGFFGPDRALCSIAFLSLGTY